MYQQEVKYLGLKLSHGTQALGKERIKPILQHPLPRTIRQLHGFLGITDYHWICIPGYGELQSLQKLLKDTKHLGQKALQWEPGEIHAFKPFQQALFGPALNPPTGNQFNIFVTVRSGIALGILTQPKGNSQQPIAYLRKELNSVTQGWLHCLQIVALVALFIPETTKLITDWDLVVSTSHGISGILKSKGGLWLSDNQLFR